jgi:hypothetical protein
MTMPILEDLKEYAERATGLRRPGKRKAPELIQARKPLAARFKDDGHVSNHPRWPLIIYRGAIDLDERHDPAAVIEDLFEANGWGDTWREASTTTCTITPGFMRSSASRAARAAFGSAATRAGSSR